MAHPLSMAAPHRLGAATEPFLPFVPSSLSFGEFSWVPQYFLYLPDNQKNIPPTPWCWEYTGTGSYLLKRADSLNIFPIPCCSYKLVMMGYLHHVDLQMLQIRTFFLPGDLATRQAYRSIMAPWTQLPILSPSTSHTKAYPQITTHLKYPSKLTYESNCGKDIFTVLQLSSTY